ncbi:MULTISPECIES: MBL fold metallo-hydrolase [unclassified Synechocystis]|uniref:MBL fold metallo-hydrolase n=1 Tax=unclassified Synechocystis TaxID=2640012 RepID=UPI0003F889E6|nr:MULTISPECIES: MBL fold metallo-hydrolase [unclassified Synechocystis]AIE74881.1 Metallo-beta-lactamase superfamily protein [Synechocystis sp. PCC 6714]MCT0253402.1 MBL fold metallo-hydrolase [Synechocystis sp. CS-94]
MTFKIKFWGVRGSIPCPGPATVRYGGNTTCVEMIIGQERLIFDAGTGIKMLGDSLEGQDRVSAHIFFTHSHWDHIQGFPFFAPAFRAGNFFRVYGVPTPNGMTIEQRLHEQMLHPNFPVPLQTMQGIVAFYDLEVGEDITIGEISLQTRPLNHPGEAMGYRINWRGITVAFVTDTEHFPDRLDDNVLILAKNADVLIVDATYTDEEYYDRQVSKVGWGHSTWQEAVKVAQAAGVGQLVLFHHDPSHDDSVLDTILDHAKQQFFATAIAKEGMEISLAPGTMDDPLPTITIMG